MRGVLQLTYGVAVIVGLIAIQAAAFYAIWWLVVAAMRFVPLIGRKHRHRDWERLNR
jgi:hypothetical protein